MNDLQITEYKNIRVLTTQQIAEAYGSDTTMTVFIWHREVPYQTRKTEKSIIAKCN